MFDNSPVFFGRLPCLSFDYVVRAGCTPSGHARCLASMTASLQTPTTPLTPLRQVNIDSYIIRAKPDMNQNVYVNGDFTEVYGNTDLAESFEQKLNIFQKHSKINQQMARYLYRIHMTITSAYP